MIRDAAESAAVAAIRRLRSYDRTASEGAWLASGCAVFLAMLGTADLARAQQAPPAPAAQAQSGAVSLQEVTVTGSRIRRTTDFNTPTPTTVIDSGTMESLGIVNVGEALTMTPANISTFSPANTGNANFFTGSYIADLRGLNPFFGSRTLTLVNTRRVVQTNQGDSVDLNFIPQILVDRVDTVTGGASAAYGSGAIAGVINVILDTKLEGAKIDGDFFQTSHSDARDRHFGAAYGHGLFDNKLHFVIGGEYENQDSLGCQNARSWCAADSGDYPIGISGRTPGYQSPQYLPGGLTIAAPGTGLRSNQSSVTGVFYSPTATSGTTPQTTADGTALAPYTLGAIPYPGDTALNPVPGGSGIPIYQYTNLMAPVNRGVIMGSLTWAITDSINFSADANWGKVTTTNITQGVVLGETITSQNAYLTPAIATALTPSAIPGADASRGYFKDWTSQVNNYTQFTTNVKRFSFGFDGKFGESSWTWDTYYTYGLTQREQLVNDIQRPLSMAMALDTVMVNGAPECRVTADGGYAAALADAAAHGIRPSYALAGSDGPLLAQGCQPINPFGTGPVSDQAVAYAFGDQDERLRYEQTVAAGNVSGNYFGGIGAGPFAAAAGYEWRQEVGHNDETYCAPGDAVCVARTNDILNRYGKPFGGKVTVDEAFLETNIPLLKNKRFAHDLEFDLAARESRYDNAALYGINVVNGVRPEFTHDLTTWKASMIYEPVDWFRFRGSQSRDARAANFRELYYGQVLTAGGLFGYCGPAQSDPCQFNLEGNVNLHPETSDTTTVGIVLTPRDLLPGFQFSADWFHIKINDAIEQASSALVTNSCRAGQAWACAQMTFNNTVYTDGTSGAAGWQAGHYNAASVTALSYNGAFYEVRGIDFSLNYLLDLRAAGSLNTRLLTTWMGEQKFQQYQGGPVFNILGQTGNGNQFLNDYQPDARWRGNLMVTWSKGPLSLTPSMEFVGRGIQDFLGVTPSNPDWAAVLANNNPALTRYGYHPILDNHVPSYFLFNFNATYQFEQERLSGLQLFMQVNNVFNRTPPMVGGSISAFGVGNAQGGTNPIFFDTLGLAWRAGFRLSF